MNEYLDTVEYVLTYGKVKQGAQAVKKISTFETPKIVYNLEEGFPLITTRDMSKTLKALYGELLWIISGSTNVNDLHKSGIRLWDQWATPETSGKLGFTNGNLGPVYGHELRNYGGSDPDAQIQPYGYDQLFYSRPPGLLTRISQALHLSKKEGPPQIKGINQLDQIIGMLKRSPDTGRALITFWNPGDVEVDGQEKVFIAPCIAMLHFFHQEGELGLHIFQRSADLGVGVPFDTAEMALLLSMVALELKMKPKRLIHTLSDAHIYEDQVPFMKELLKRNPRRKPTISISETPSGTIYDHKLEDFHLENYDPYPPMKIPVAT